MTKGLLQVQFLCFAIIAKSKYRNSIILGSLNQISKKLEVSDYITRKQINYGLKNGLIIETKGGYKVVKYKTILDSIDTIKHVKHIKLFKEGNFAELVEKNLFAIARINFNQQLFRGKQSATIKELRKLVTEKTEIKGRFSKKEYDLYNKSKNRVLGENYIVTGQKHLCKLLNISQGLASKLLSRWSELKLIFRTIIYTPFFDKNDTNYSLKCKVPMICLGTRVGLIS